MVSLVISLGNSPKIGDHVVFEGVLEDVVVVGDHVVDAMVIWICGDSFFLCVTKGFCRFPRYICWLFYQFLISA